MIKHLESKKHDRLERVHIKRTEAWTDSIRGDWTGTVLLLSGMASLRSLFSHGAPATCLADLIFIIIPTQMKTVQEIFPAWCAPNHPDLTYSYCENT